MLPPRESGQRRGIGQRRPHDTRRVRVELAREQPSFWQNYKFMNPATKKVEPKQMYCERLNETMVCGGVYSF